MTATRYGATEQEWDHFGVKLQIPTLPVVCNPDAKISSKSGIAVVGKVPSGYDEKRNVVGIPKWTEITASGRPAKKETVAKWERESDYGTCIPTSAVPAIDIDVTDSALVAEIRALVDKVAGVKLPARGRANSARVLLAARVSGKGIRKTIVKTPAGAIEFLADGQQFVAAGTHKSGMRYEWEGGLPEFPTLSVEKWQTIIRTLQERFEINNTKPASADKADSFERAAVVHQVTDETIADLRSALQALEPDDYHAWQAIGSNLRCLDHKGFELWQEWSLRSPKSEQCDLDAKWRALGGDQSDYRAVFAKAQAAGWVNPRAGVVVKNLSPKGTRFHDLAARINDGRDYLIKGLLQKQSFAIIYGDPGSGKTFVALDIAYHIATGKTWRDRRISSGPVWYLAFEGMGGMPKRVTALEKHHSNAADIPFVIEAADFNLRDLSGRKALSERLAEVIGNDFAGVRPAMIVFDTFARAIPGADENSAQDVGEFNKAVEELIRASGACVLVLHHKNKTGGMRGSSALLGACETRIEIEDGKLLTDKQRDIEIAAPIGFKLVPVPLGADADGDLIYSCVVEPCSAKPKTKPLPAHAADALKALCDLSPSNAPVAEHDWQVAFERRAWPVDPPESKSRRVAFRRAVKILGERVTSPQSGQWQRPLSAETGDRRHPL